MIVVVLLVIVVIVVAGALFAMNALNRLRSQRVSVDEAAGGIEVQLTRRAELIPNLVETVKGYMTHEADTLTAITEARSSGRRSGSIEEMAAEDAQTRQALANVFAVAEAYPDLKASQNFQQLQGELARTEDQLAFARQYYNDAAATLNKTMVTIPYSFFVGMSGVDKAVFYQAPEANQAPPQVSFG